MNVTNIRLRSELLKAIRTFFYSKSVTEVMTPTLREHGSSEVYIDSIHIDGRGYLQTSPEHFMKCLLSKYQKSIFQICSVFRAGEVGPLHKEEFQMLEWYRSLFGLSDLIEELEDLISVLVDELSLDFDIIAIKFPFVKKSYKSFFLENFSVNPHSVSMKRLREMSRDIDFIDKYSSRSECLDALFAMSIQPKIIAPTFVTDFPACQAAQAEFLTNTEGERVANRFELYIRGVELANAYQELRDPDEMKARFEANNALRFLKGKPQMEHDMDLIECLPGMPRCAGASIGIERLMMLLTGSCEIHNF